MATLACSLSVVLLGLVAAGCSAPDSPPPSEVDVASAPLRATTAVTPYTFFLVSRAGTGFVASELGASSTACFDGSIRSACPFGDLDLSTLGLASADADAITGDVTSDAASSTLLFVGAFARRTTIRASSIALAVQEVWRAPAVGTIRASDDWYHVSHDGAQALAVNRWQQRMLASIDLSAAPWMSDCDPDDAGVLVCTPTQDGVLEDAETPAGIVVDGSLSRRGVLHVRQYFAKVSVGSLHATNGYWYCADGQTACPNGACAKTADACTHEGFHGGGLKTVYTRTSQAVAQPWLVSTTQLTAAESAALQAPASP